MILDFIHLVILLLQINPLRNSDYLLKGFKLFIFLILISIGIKFTNNFKRPHQNRNNKFTDKGLEKFALNLAKLKNLEKIDFDFSS